MFATFSCGGNNDPYKDKIVNEGDKIITTGDIQRTYESTDSNNNKLNIKDLKVYYPTKDAEHEIPYLDITSSDIKNKQFFITTSNTAPTKNRFTSATAFGTRKQKETHNVYIAFLYDDGKIHISNGIEVTVTNKKAINPLVYYIGGPVLIIAVAAIVAFTKKYKQTH